MFIQVEETPNPLTLKFLPGKTILETKTRYYKREENYQDSPLAAQLFAIEGVESVFLGGNFISVSRGSQYSWENLKPFILTQLMDFFLSGQLIILEKEESCSSYSKEKEGDVLSSQIQALLEEKIRPAVAMDGGDIIFDHFHEGTVYLKMQGACAGCPSSTATLKSGIENMLRHYIPEVIDVKAI